jgi:adenosylhomocysteinase
VNLAAAEGHPASVMDMSFATQALSCAWMATQQKVLTPAVYDVPEEIENTVATLKLASMHTSIDTLTKEQQKYLSSWEVGT